MALREVVKAVQVEALQVDRRRGLSGAPPAEGRR